jgi:hypothetical protein
LLLFCTAIILVFRAMSFARMWRYHLSHGPGYFLGVAVPSGFYSGDGVRWQRSYRAVLVAEAAVEALGLGAVLMTGRWRLLPVWAGGVAVLATVTYFGFTTYTRATLGSNAPVRARAAAALETRRLRDYVRWPAEACIGAITAMSWALLLTRGGSQVEWGGPVILTYVIAGLLPFKAAIVRRSSPLPAERTAEYHRWLEANRRYGLRAIDAMRWFLLAILAGSALLHGVPEVQAAGWIRWLLIGVALGIYLWTARMVRRENARLEEMGRGLQPVGSWPGPLGRAKQLMPGFSYWFAAWFGGLVALIVWFQR